MIFHAAHTHLYPGHRGKTSAPARIADLRTQRDCLVAFSDGSAATARISRHEHGWQLHTRAYTTAAGSAIPEKRWIIDLQQAGDEVEFRILGKAGKND